MLAARSFCSVVPSQIENSENEIAKLPRPTTPKLQPSFCGALLRPRCFTRLSFSYYTTMSTLLVVLLHDRYHEEVSPVLSLPYYTASEMAAF